VQKTTSLAGSASKSHGVRAKVADRFGTMTLPYQIGSNAAFDYVGFNGRWLSDDVMDVMLSRMTNSALGDGVAPNPELNVELHRLPEPTDNRFSTRGIEVLAGHNHPMTSIEFATVGQLAQQPLVEFLVHRARVRRLRRASMAERQC
jgi:hypothetical protein